MVRAFWTDMRAQGKRSSSQGNDVCCFIHSSGKKWNKQIKSKSYACCHCLLCLQTFDPALEVGLWPSKKRAITVMTQSQLC